jgi:hypothetical protein
MWIKTGVHHTQRVFYLSWEVSLVRQVVLKDYIQTVPKEDVVPKQVEQASNREEV